MNYFAFLTVLAMMVSTVSSESHLRKTLTRPLSRRLEEEVPTERECTTLLAEDEFTFECKATSIDGLSVTKDEIDFSVERSSRGIIVKIKYEQEIENEMQEDDEADEEVGGQEDSEVDGEMDSENEEAGTDAESGESGGQTTDEESDGDTETEGQGDMEGETVGDEEAADEEVEVVEQFQLVQEAESETKYQVVFDRIIEYAKTSNGGSQAYDRQQDEVVQSIALPEWQDFSEISNDDTGRRSTFSVTSSDGVAIFHFTIARAGEGEAVSANKMKIDVNLVNFPWNRTDTYVALISTIETERDVDVAYATNANEASDEATNVFVNFGGSAAGPSGLVPFGEFTWATEAEATSVAANNSAVVVTDTIDVIATSWNETNNVETIAFSFVGLAAQGSPNIYWDPEAGVGYATSDSPVFNGGQQVGTGGGNDEGADGTGGTVGDGEQDGETSGVGRFGLAGTAGLVSVLLFLMQV